MAQERAAESHHLLKSAGAMGAGTLLSRCLGLVREQVFAHLFGAGHAADAFQIAFRIPNLLRDLFAEGAMSSAFVPTFTRVKLEQGTDAAWGLASRMMVALVILVSALSALGIVFAPELVGLFASAFRGEPGKFELTVLLTRVMFPFFPLVALAAVFMGVLNASGRFFMPAFASALFNLSSVVSGIALGWLAPGILTALTPLPIEGAWSGAIGILGMAYGVVIGGAVQTFAQWPTLRRAGFRFGLGAYRLLTLAHDPGLRRVLVLMVPGLVGLGATQINVLVNSMLATQSGGGAVAYLQYAFRLMQFPIGIFGVSLASAALPVLSQHWASNRVQAGADTLVGGLRSVFALCFPATAGLAVLAVPIVALLFEHGRFSSADTFATALAVRAYALGLVAYAAVKVLVPACYALGRARLAVSSSILTVAVTLAFNLWWVERLGFWGLALGTSAGALFNALWLLGGVAQELRRRQSDLPWLALLGGITLYGAIGAVVAIALLAVERGLSSWDLMPIVGVFGSRLIHVGAGLVTAASVLLILAKLPVAVELREILAAGRRLLGRRISR